MALKNYVKYMIYKYELVYSIRGNNCFNILCSGMVTVPVLQESPCSALHTTLHCITLKCVAHYTVLYHTTLHCTLLFNVSHCNALHTALRHTVLRLTALHCTSLQ